MPSPSPETVPLVPSPEEPSPYFNFFVRAFEWFFENSHPEWVDFLHENELFVYSFLIWIISVLSYFAREAFLFYERDRRKYVGLWEFDISWDSKWAQETFGLLGTGEIKSIGNVLLTYSDGSRATEYTGFGEFTLKEGGHSHAFLFVKIKHFEIKRPIFSLRRYFLSSFEAYTEKRFIVGEKVLEDHEAPRTYKMRFNEATATNLKGEMYAITSTKLSDGKIKKAENQVGLINAQCVR